MRKMNLRRAGLCTIAAALALGSVTANAGTLTFQGVTFTTTTVDSNTFTLQIQGALDATGDWANITHLWLLGIKNVGSVSLTGGDIEGTAADTWTNEELNASGNDCGPGSPPAASCFAFNPVFALTNDFTLTISLTGTGTFDFSAVHVKVAFLCGANTVGDPCGNLLSQDITSSSSSGSGSGETSSSSSGAVPEPASSTLVGLGLGLLGFGFMRRRKNAA